MKHDRIAPRAEPAGDSAVAAWLRALEMTASIAKSPERILPVVIEELAAERGDAPALISDRESFSFRELAERARRYERWALAQDLTKGDVICLLMPNRPDTMAVWLGITRMGGIVALLNTNLVGQSLAHCIDIVQPKHIIVDATLAGTLDTARPHLATRAKLWPHGDIAEQFDAPEATDMERASVTTADCALYIYTSGTTGLPKAARVSHRRLMTWSAWFAGMIGTRPHDRMYNCLPMYHSVGGVVATGAVLLNGGSAVIAERFSAGEFWRDVQRWDCTLAQYIGELCRYLLHMPPHPDETAHRLRLVCGNGLRPDVWEQFQSRFRIPKILEFYAATEGNVTLFNAEGKPGAIGRIPAFLAHRSPVMLVRHDPETGEPARDEHGLCVRCTPNETGEAIGLVAEGRSEVGSPFEGYTSREESERKVLRNALKPGDAWFRTGDLMRKDVAGYFYFVDRIGDTFRWKGENVSTAEVAECLTAFAGVTEANVYGVTVPGQDGRAGMAAIVANGALDLAALRRHIAERLPAYARPVFLRLRDAIEITTTFKHRKSELSREGFDPAAIVDPLFVHDPERQTYIPLDAPLYGHIVDGQMRL